MERLLGGALARLSPLHFWKDRLAKLVSKKGFGRFLRDEQLELDQVHLELARDKISLRWEALELNPAVRPMSAHTHLVRAPNRPTLFLSLFRLACSRGEAGVLS
jgi:hypothetical protein